jgi:hypothetical protein
MASRTRPKAEGKRPDRTVQPPLNGPYPGCCTPYPDARFVNEIMVELNAHHVGKRCRGFLEPIDREEWYAEIDRLAADHSRNRGDDG